MGRQGGQTDRLDGEGRESEERRGRVKRLGGERKW